MKITRPNLAQYFDLPNPGLRAYFRRTEQGNSDDYRPPFWKGEDRSSVLNRWLKELHKLGVPERFPGLYAYETEMMGKVGPMSIQLPLAERLDSIKSYYEQLRSKPIDEKAIQACTQQFRPLAGVRLRSPEQTKLKMRLNTNSGTPYFTKRKKVQDWGPGAYEEAAILGWRGQEGGISPDDVKQRVIWMMPFLLNVRELQFYQPAIEVVQQHNLIPAYVDFEYVDKEVTALFDSRENSGQIVICTDFSKFDQHFNEDMQNAAQSIISGLCPHLIDWINDVFPVKYYIPLICSEQIMFSGHHGMGSGSGGTNFDESLAHRALQYEVAMYAGQELNRHSMAYGDDGILTYPGIDVDDVIKAYSAHGQEMNPDKQMVSTTDAIVLRRWHSTNYRKSGIMVGVYATFRALGRLLSQERFYDPDKWGPKQVTLRAWSILENCKYSPYFEQFVDFVLEGDAFRLGLALPGGLNEIIDTYNAAIEADEQFLGFVKTQMANKQGARDWSIYKYLKEKENGN